ncbi:MAG: hypothetical protein JNM47_05980 [Hyphomonadaceae bacterium]|nr:hypothetical protein [Hyphomonadaceae bacterium]
MSDGVIIVRSYSSFDDEFPEVTIGPRTGSAKRTQSDTERWVCRLAMKACLESGVICAPFRIRSIPNTPICRTPDFELCQSSGISFVEITEATDPADQREFTLSERAGEACFSGDHGGRGSGGFAGDMPERLVAQDVLSAIEKKRAHYDEWTRARTLLAIYPNSSPAPALTRERLTAVMPNSLLSEHGFMGVIVVTPKWSIIHHVSQR